jgi:hypothetical protein
LGARLRREQQRELDLAAALTLLRQGQVSGADTAEAPILLKAGEELLFVLHGITLREPRSVTTGGYGGPSIHVAKGLTLRVGGFRAQSHEELKEIDSGALRSLEVTLAKLISVDAYSDAVAIRRTGKERTEFFFGLDQHSYRFEIEGRSYSEPFSGLILKYAIEGQLNPTTG